MLFRTGSDRQYTGAVPSALMRVFAVIQFVRKPAEALSPKGADPRQLRGLVSGGSLRVGPSWVSNGVGRRYSATEPYDVSPSDQARAYGLRRRRESAPGSARPNVLWFGPALSGVRPASWPACAGSHAGLLGHPAGLYLLRCDDLASPLPILVNETSLMCLGSDLA